MKSKENKLDSTWWLSLLTGIIVAGLAYLICWFLHWNDSVWTGWILLVLFISGQTYHDMKKGEK